MMAIAAPGIDAAPQLVAHQTVDRRQVDRRTAIGGSRLGGPEDSAGGQDKKPASRQTLLVQRAAALRWLAI